MAARSKTLAQVRARLDELVDLRLSGPLSDGKLAEYEELLALEATLLEASLSEGQRGRDATAADEAGP